MRTKSLLPPLAALTVAALTTPGCAELASVTPSVTVDVVARQRVDDAGERWSWAVGARLGTRLGSSAGTADDPDDELDVGPAAGGGALGCSVAPLCVWEADARARALARVRAWAGEEP